MIRPTGHSGASKDISLNVGVFWPPCAILFESANIFFHNFSETGYSRASKCSRREVFNLVSKKVVFLSLSARWNEKSNFWAVFYIYMSLFSIFYIKIWCNEISNQNMPKSIWNCKKTTKNLGIVYNQAFILKNTTFLLIKLETFRLQYFEALEYPVSEFFWKKL